MAPNATRQQTGKRTYDIPDEQHLKLKRMAGWEDVTQAAMLTVLIEAEWQRSTMMPDNCPKLERNHEKD